MNKTLGSQANATDEEADMLQYPEIRLLHVGESSL